MTNRRRFLIHTLVALLVWVAFARVGNAQTEAVGNDYEPAFKDLYEHLGAVYPCLEMKHIDWNEGLHRIPRSPYRAPRA
jgi:hypothetical protein